MTTETINTQVVVVDDTHLNILTVGIQGPAGGGGVTDHGALAGLEGDDHTQYHTNARGDARYYTQNQIDTAFGLKVTANGAITGATKTKVTYDAKGLVTAGADATTADITEGSNLYYTDERAQDAVGGMVGATLTYVDGTPSLGINLSNANTWAADQSVPDEAYSVGWNGSVEVPTKNAVYDKINSMFTGTANITVDTSAPSSPATGDVWIDTN